MRTEIENIFYEIKHGIFPAPIYITFEEYILVEEVVSKSGADKFLLRCYLEKWAMKIACYYDIQDGRKDDAVMALGMVLMSTR